MHGIKHFEHLTPRTATFPMTLGAFVESEMKSQVVDHSRITPERKAWHDRQVAKGTHTAPRLVVRNGHQG
jgi:hypothetical protein